MTVGLRSRDSQLAAAFTILLQEHGLSLTELSPTAPAEEIFPYGCDKILTDLDTCDALGLPEELTVSFDRQKEPSLLRPFREDALLVTLLPGTEPNIFVGTTASAATHHTPFYFDGTALYGGGKQVFLSKRERQIFTVLYNAGGQVVSAEQIAQAVWNDPTQQNSVHVYIRYIRKKMEEICALPYILTVRGAGFRLRCEDER